MSEKGGQAETSTSAAQVGQEFNNGLSVFKGRSLAPCRWRFNASCLE